MSAVDELDQQILTLTQEKDAAIADYKAKIAALRSQREQALAQDKVAAMTEAERASLKAALDAAPEASPEASPAQTVTPEPAVSEPVANAPAEEGAN